MRIYNENGAHDREVYEHLREVDADSLVHQAYKRLVDAGYESRDAQAYLVETLTCFAGHDRITKAFAKRKAEAVAKTS